MMTEQHIPTTYSHEIEFEVQVIYGLMNGYLLSHSLGEDYVVYIYDMISADYKLWLSDGDSIFMNTEYDRYIRLPQVKIKDRMVKEGPEAFVETLRNIFDNPPNMKWGYFYESKRYLLDVYPLKNMKSAGKRK